ncbi:TonB-dependent receptor [Compostibacter hankyongensis]|uniref:TonB-dependent receptor n=2 Tax=Compostibacter hankyongensis TaxID=1007089 RepID=A0ABP8FIE1_9BACT
MAQKDISGKITSNADKQPVVGATIRLKGTTTGTVTGADGSFKLTIPGTGDEQLEVSFVGFNTKTIPVGDQSTFNIGLDENASTLEEIVVTGYTTQKKKDLTGSVAVVNVDEMTRQPSGTVTKQLQGQASGVTVVGSGQPGSNPQVRIRGVNTFGNNTPLYVVDGVPTQNIADLNPNDVASMQVLKDAGAASIYGSRASNGVIIITTKKGSGKVTVSYDGYYGTQRPLGGNPWHTLTPMEMAQLKFNALENTGTPVTAAKPDPLYGGGPDPTLPDYIEPAGAKEGSPEVDPSKYNVNMYDDGYSDFYRIVRANKTGTDYFHAIFKPAPITSHNIAVSGGGEKGNYLFSFNYFNQQGTLIETHLKRYTIRSNTQFNITQHVRVGENLAYSITDNPTISDLTEGSAIGMAMRQQPIIPVYDIMGNYAGSFSSAPLGNARNPVAIQERTRNNRGYTNRLFGNMFVEADFLQHFTVRTSFGGESFATSSHSFTFPQYENQENETTTASYTENSSYGYNWTWTNTLQYKQRFNDMHDLQVLIGTEAYNNAGRNLGGTTKDYFSFDPSYTSLTSGTGTPVNSSSSYTDGLFSLIGRLDYSFRDKYLLSATVRRDGSSKFATYQYGWFPAVTAGWRISQENFMKDISWLSDLKIRGGYGVMGNQLNVEADNPYSTFNLDKGNSYYDIRGTSSSIDPGLRQNRIGAPDAKWEKDVNANIGLDASMFDGMLELSADYYRKDIRDLLYNQALPGTAGNATVPFVNVAKMKNSGVDASVRVATDLAKDLKLTATVSFTTYRNEIVNVSTLSQYFDQDGRRFNGASIIRNAVGQPVSSFFGYKVTGFWNDQQEIAAANEGAKKATGDTGAVYQTDVALGRFRYADINGDGVITPDDRTYLGSPNPDFSYGLNLGLTYKNFDFSIFLYGVQGAEIWNNLRWWMDFYSSFAGAKSKTALYDSWTPEHHNARAPIQENVGSFSTNSVPNSYFVENGSYLRAKNMQLGYTFSPNLIRRIGLEKLRVYIQAANVFTITKYTGTDPEINGNGVTDYGIDEGAYPNQREFLVGVNLSF